MARTKFAFLAATAMTAGVLVAQQLPVSDTVMNPLVNNPTAASEGQRIYDGTCQTCHGSAGTGDRDRGGPALNTTGLKHGDGDADLFRTIRQGVAGTQMPPYKGLRDEQIWQLVSYIRSLQSGPAASTATAARVTEGDVAAGEVLFFGRAGCSSCHEVNARGGITGPDLSNAGTTDCGRSPSENCVAERAAASGPRRSRRRRWTWRRATGHDRRPHAGRTRDSWCSPQ